MSSTYVKGKGEGIVYLVCYCINFSHRIAIIEKYSSSENAEDLNFIVLLALNIEQLK